jgi:hypothetical protein
MTKATRGREPLKIYMVPYVKCPYTKSLRPVEDCDTCVFTGGFRRTNRGCYWAARNDDIEWIRTTFERYRKRGKPFMSLP